MRNFIVLLFTMASVVAFGQRTDVQLKTQNENTIKALPLTPAKVGAMFDSIIVSKLNIADTASFSGVYSGSSPTTVSVGTLPAGSAISGNTYEQIFQKMLAAYVNSVFNSFAVSGGTNLEVGLDVGQSWTGTWSISANSGTITSVDIYDVTTSTVLLNTPNDGSNAFTAASNVLTLGEAQTWRAIGHNSNPGGPSTFNSANYSKTGRDLIFAGPRSSDPSTSGHVRSLQVNNVYHVGATSFTYTTGNTDNFQYVYVPPGKTITSILDLTQAGDDITGEFITDGTFAVQQAGGTGSTVNYVKYKRTALVPYPSSHTLQITVAP